MSPQQRLHLIQGVSGDAAFLQAVEKHVPQGIQQGFLPGQSRLHDGHGAGGKVSSQGLEGLAPFRTAVSQDGAQQFLDVRHVRLEVGTGGDHLLQHLHQHVIVLHLGDLVRSRRHVPGGILSIWKVSMR